MPPSVIVEPPLVQDGAAPARYFLAGTNAAVVGLLAAAFYSPIWVTTITDGTRFALALAAFGALQFLRAPS